MISLSQACKAKSYICGPAKKIASTETKHILKSMSESGSTIMAIDKNTGNVLKTIEKEAVVDGAIRHGNYIYHGKQHTTRVFNSNGDLIQINRLTDLGENGKILESVKNPNSKDRVITVVESAKKGGGTATVNKTYPNNFNYGTSYWITPGEPKTKFFDGRSKLNMNFDYNMGF